MNDDLKGGGEPTPGETGCPLCGQTPRPPGPHPVWGSLSSLLLLSAPVLWGLWVWTGDGRYGWLTLPVLFAAVVVFVVAFVVEPKGGGR